jgi:hypothetical protein
MNYEQWGSVSCPMEVATPDACEFSGLTRPMVDYLAREGLVQASGGASQQPGRGRPRAYNVTDLALLWIGERCLRARIEISSLKKEFVQLRAFIESERPLKSRSLALIGQGQFMAFENFATAEVDTMLRTSGVVIVVDVESAVINAGLFAGKKSGMQPFPIRGLGT